MRVRVGCECTFESRWPTPLVLVLGIAHGEPCRVLEEDRLIEPAVAFHEYLDTFGNRCWRLNAPTGALRVVYDALVEVSNEPDPVLLDAPQTPVQDLPDEVLQFTLPSRHCQSDTLSDAAWNLFGHVPPGWARVQAICDWIHQHVQYQKGSTVTTSAADIYESRAGVCRDFAHLGVTFCRALNIPARYVAGFLPDAGIVPPPEPMDFHAWFEAYVDGRWRTFDARHNVPRIGRIPIAHGRDAVDVAIVTSYGAARLQAIEVWADEVDERGLVLSGLNLGTTLAPRVRQEVGA